LWLTYLLLAPGANEELVVKIREGLDWRHSTASVYAFLSEGWSVVLIARQWHPQIDLAHHTILSGQQHWPASNCIARDLAPHKPPSWKGLSPRANLFFVVSAGIQALAQPIEATMYSYSRLKFAPY
jgi:hypothetical protein